MFTSLFVKKKLSHKQIAFKFVHHTLQIIDETYGDFLDAIFYDQLHFENFQNCKNRFEQ